MNKMIKIISGICFLSLTFLQSIALAQPSHTIDINPEMSCKTSKDCVVVSRFCSECCRSLVMSIQSIEKYKEAYQRKCDMTYAKACSTRLVRCFKYVAAECKDSVCVGVLTDSGIKK